MKQKAKARSANDFQSFNLYKDDVSKFEQIKKHYENKLGISIKTYQVYTILFDEKLKEIVSMEANDNGNECE